MTSSRRVRVLLFLVLWGLWSCSGAGESRELSPGPGVERSAQSAGPAFKLQDLNTRPFSLTYEDGPAVVGDTVYLAAGTSSTGVELWRSDGTTAGTRLVKDLRPGPDGSFPSQLTVMNGVLYFTANDGNSGVELWKSDGTEAGTVLVKNLHPTYDASPAGLTVMDGVLYFAANDGNSGVELWKSDGTEAGTVLVKDIQPGSSSSAPSDFTVVNGVLYFTAYEGGTGVELWKSDGTEAGTVLVKDIQPGPGSSYSSQLTVFNGALYFRADDGGTGAELWKSDGTEAGTVLVKDIQPGSGSAYPQGFTLLNGELYFSADDGGTGVELWKSDGTEAGTVLVKDIRPGPGSSFSGQLTVFNGELYFSADDGSTGSELWKSDGTEAGTVLVKDIRPGPGSSSPAHPTVLDGELYFTADDGNSGVELWKSDGTGAGTVLVKDLLPGAGGGLAQSLDLYAVRGALYFRADDGSGLAWWKSDGTGAGTVRVGIPVTTLSSSPGEFTRMGPWVYFHADNGITGGALWKSDGTEAGTVLVENLYPYDLHALDGELYFFARAGLWKSDGTEAGTVLLREFSSVSISPRNLTAFNDALFFGVDGELWKSDGTAAGTVLLKYVGQGSYSTTFNFTPFNGRLYLGVWSFSMSDLVTQFLWSTDGTEAGTVREIGPEPSDLSNFAVMGDALYFAGYGYSETDGRELWRFTTPGGARRVKDIRPGREGSRVTALTPVGGVLYFTADDGVSGNELWRSDGTEAGTVRVKDIRPGPGGSEPTALTALGGMLYFTADDGVSGRELWKSDGTEAGTVLVSDLWPGPSSGISQGSRLLALGLEKRVLFAASDGVSGEELWASDGTPAGTQQVMDVFPGPDSSSPMELYRAGPLVYFSALDDDGREPWVLPVGRLWVAPPPQLTCPGPVTVKDAGSSGAVVEYPPATATDASGAVPELTYSHASGSRFPVGTTWVVVTATDEAGNGSSCAFPVTVLKKELIPGCGCGASPGEVSATWGLLVLVLRAWRHRRGMRGHPSSPRGTG